MSTSRQPRAHRHRHRQPAGAQEGLAGGVRLHRRSPLPYLLVALPFAHAFFLDSFFQNEGSPAPNGLPMRWVIKGFLYFAFWSVFFAVISVLCRRIVFLFGAPELAERRCPGGSTQTH